MDDFPLPLAPLNRQNPTQSASYFMTEGEDSFSPKNTYTTATLSPTPTSRFIFLSISTPLRLGYSNVTFSNRTTPLRVGDRVDAPAWTGIAGRRSMSSNIRTPAPIPRIIVVFCCRARVISQYHLRIRRIKIGFTYKERPALKK